MMFDIYGQFIIEVVREADAWAVYRKGAGLRRRENDLAIPPELDSRDIQTFLDDFYHELARPGDAIRPMT